MRLVTYDAGRGRAGRRAARRHDLRPLGRRASRSARRTGRSPALLRGGLLPELEPAPGDGIPLESVTLLPPIGDPGKIVCIGLNYRSHAAEAGIDAPERPTFFGKFANALAPPGRRRCRCREGSDKVDYEAEIAVVIGARCSRVAPDAALDHVAGYMLFNDLSARDWQFATPQWMPGKVFDGVGALRPRARHAGRGRARTTRSSSSSS